MKDRTGAILRPEQERYLERLQPPRDPLLTEIEGVAADEGVPISDPEVGRLLQLLARSHRATRILELGTALGYGTLLLARGASEARLVTVDRDPQMQERARGYLERGGVLDRVELVTGEALATLDRLEGPFDLVYVDAQKTDYRRYLDRILMLMPVGGVVIFDNLLWKGRVAEIPEEDDPSADAIRAFNGYMMIHPQLVAQVLPLGDGVGLAVKAKPLMTDLGGPY